MFTLNIYKFSSKILLFLQVYLSVSNHETVIKWVTPVHIIQMINEIGEQQMTKEGKEKLLGFDVAAWLIFLFRKKHISRY